MICSSGRSTTSMVMSLGSLRSEMGSDPRFGSGGLCQTIRPLFCWGSPQSETKRVFSGVSLGNPRGSPPRRRSRTGGTRSISMGYEVKHFGRRQFFRKTGHHFPCFKPPAFTRAPLDLPPTYRRDGKSVCNFFHRRDFFRAPDHRLARGRSPAASIGTD